MTEVKHPAPYSKSVIEAMKFLVVTEADRRGIKIDDLRILDPMAGIGRVHELPGATVGVEIEPEWASQHPGTRQGDACDLGWPEDTFDVIAVSPAYGNRFADHHEAKDGSKRRSYRHDLGRMPSEGSSGTLHWGPDYRFLHIKAWREATRVLVPGGLFILNVSDFVAKGAIVPVAEWHLNELFCLRYRLESAQTISTPRMRFGANHQARVDGELVAALRAAS